MAAKCSYRNLTGITPYPVQDAVRKSVRLVDKRHGLQTGDFKTLAAAGIGAVGGVVAQHHVVLRLGETGAVAVVGAAGKLALLAANEPVQLILTRYATPGTDERVGSEFGSFVKEIALFHTAPPGIHTALPCMEDNAFRASVASVHTGKLVMSKAKKKTFSATQAVKANARERLGTPPPEIVLPDDKTRSGRRASKHKETLQKLLQREEER